MSDLRKSSYDFVLQCYFGDLKNPVDAAINKAYVDMASHTLKCYRSEEYEKKWDCRYKASKEIKKALNGINAENYDDWHKKLCEKLMSVYGKTDDGEDKLSFGQAQKWLNMTCKYLQVFAIIFKDIGDDEKLQLIPQFFMEAKNIKKLHVPLDSYIMKEYKISSSVAWSKMDEKQYEDCRGAIKDKSLEDELNDWCKAADKYRVNDKESYAFYLEKKLEITIFPMRTNQSTCIGRCFLLSLYL